MIITQNTQNTSRYQKIIGHLRTMWSMRSLKVRDFTIEPVPRSAIQAFVHRWHYSHDTNGVQQTQCFALFDDMKMIGAMIYALPSMKSTAAKYNPDNPLRCWELRRLCCIDDTLKNTESYFIGYTLRWLRDNTEIKKVISYADETYNHRGVIYKASNFKHLGMTNKGKVIVYKNKKLTYKTHSIEVDEAFSISFDLKDK